MNSLLSTIEYKLSILPFNWSKDLYETLSNTNKSDINELQALSTQVEARYDSYTGVSYL